MSTRNISLTHLKTLHMCGIAWCAQITSHANVGFWDEFSRASLAQIHKYEMHQAPSVKLLQV